jgi:hypothetical protein
MLCAFPLLSALTKRKGLGVNGFTLPLNFYGMRRRGVACFCFLTAILAACTNNDQKAAKKPAPDRIYLDYKISGEEENENVTCLIRFYRGGPNGPSLVHAGAVQSRAGRAGFNGRQHQIFGSVL